MSCQLNRCDISGVILEVREYGRAKMLKITQKVAGRFETNYTIIVDTPLSTVIDVGIGDEVAVLSAVCYMYDDKFRFRISDENQFIIISKVLNQGPVKAEDLFI